MAVGHFGAQVIVTIKADVRPKVGLQNIGDSRMVDQRMKFRAQNRLIPGAQMQFIVRM